MKEGKEKQCENVEKTSAGRWKRLMNEGSGTLVQEGGRGR